jgi:hypothetical protein
MLGGTPRYHMSLMLTLFHTRVVGKAKTSGTECQQLIPDIFISPPIAISFPFGGAASSCAFTRSDGFALGHGVAKPITETCCTNSRLVTGGEGLIVHSDTEVGRLGVCRYFP